MKDNNHGQDYTIPLYIFFVEIVITINGHGRLTGIHINSFIDRYFSKFAIKSLLHIPLHLKCVATLPCKMQILRYENSDNLKHCDYW